MIIAKTLDDTEVHLPCHEILSDEYKDEIFNYLTFDLVNIFAECYHVDVTTRRTGKTNLNVSAYVSYQNIKIWNDNKETIEKLLKFVTIDDNDNWSVEFIPINLSHEKSFIQCDANSYDNVSLFSGGLDSFCGIYNNEVKEKIIQYCAYKTSGKDTSYIKKSRDFIEQRDENKDICNIFDKYRCKKISFNQRTRSLLFISLACLVASKYSINKINIHENGIMSLNPSFQSRATTKTTHPRTIYLYQTLIDNLDINVMIQHPFLFNTKGQMVKNLDLKYKNFIKNTRSCSKSSLNIEYNVEGTGGCGVCVPCLLRKISLAAYDMECFDHRYVVEYEGDISNEEYVSSVSYFRRFHDSIVNESILTEILMKPKYYNNSNYIELTIDMFNTFAKEIKTFLDKYGG